MGKTVMKSKLKTKWNKCQTENRKDVNEVFWSWRWSRQILQKNHLVGVCCCHTPQFQTVLLLYHVPSLANTGTLSASWVALPPCQPAFLSLYVSVFFFSPPPATTHLGLVIHDSWSRVSKFNLRCVKTAHIYKLCAESLPAWIVLNLFLLSNMCKISNA